MAQEKWVVRCYDENSACFHSYVSVCSSIDEIAETMCTVERESVCAAAFICVMPAGDNTLALRCQLLEQEADLKRRRVASQSCE